MKGSLLRGIGAYLKATPAQELPGNVRRFRTFTTRALTRHEETILNVLEDEGMRARIIEWLDVTKPSLPNTVAENLRTAAARSDGWREELIAAARQGRSDATPTEKTQKDDSRALERERAKVRRAREAAKKVREESGLAVASAEERTARAERLVQELQVRLAEASEHIGGTEKALGDERARSERDLRRLRKRNDQVSAQNRELRAELKELRKRLVLIEEKLSPPKPRKRAAPRTPRKVVPRGPREPLTVPKGLLEDAPETLERWLEHDEVRVVVDGYNVTLAESGFGGLELERQRDRLIEIVTGLARRKKITGTIVFDGNEVPPAAGRRPRGPVKIEYSRPDEIADDHIIALLESLPPYPVVLVTNDKELQERGSELGATVATSDQLLALIR